MKARKFLMFTLVAIVGVVMLVPEAQAIPAFARKYNLTCSSCHSAMPYINSTGRAFKEAGFRMPDEDGVIDSDAQPNGEISSDLIFDKTYPISMRVKGYVGDKVKDEEGKIRPVHEIEVLSAGNFWKEGSFLVEMEGEDEEGFAMAASGALGWHPRTEANIVAGVGSIFHADPYNSLVDGGHRLTVAHKLPLDQGSDEMARFRKDAQFISLYGRAQKVFYMVGQSGGNGNDEGENPRDTLLRGAVDFTPEAMIGGFFFNGRHTLEEAATEVDILRWGVDANLSHEGVYFGGLFMNSEVDYRGPSPAETNNSAYGELFYTLLRDSRPFLVPLVRVDWTELNDGMDTYSALVAQAGVYPIENAKVAVEFKQDLETEPGAEKSNRITLLADVVF